MEFLSPTPFALSGIFGNDYVSSMVLAPFKQSYGQPLTWAELPLGILSS